MEIRLALTVAAELCVVHVGAAGVCRHCPIVVPQAHITCTVAGPHSEHRPKQTCMQNFILNLFISLVLTAASLSECIWVQVRIAVSGKPTLTLPSAP